MTRPGGPDGQGGDTPVRPGADPATSHEEQGLDLARAVARALGRGSRGGTGSQGRRGRGQGARGSDGAGARGARAGDPVLSGSHPDERDPQLVDATIGRLIAERGWDAEVRMHAVFTRWDHIVGRDLAFHVKPVAFHPGEGGAGGRLVVRADSTAWATQVRLLTRTVVRRIGEELGEGVVTALEVEGPNVPSWKRGRRSVRGGRGPRDTYG